MESNAYERSKSAVWIILFESILLLIDSMENINASDVEIPFKNRIKADLNVQVFVRDSLFVDVVFPQKFLKMHLWLVSCGSCLHSSGHLFCR